MSLTDIFFIALTILRYTLLIYRKTQKAKENDLIGTQPKKVVHNANIQKKQKYYFLNRMKYIEGSLVKFSGKISREH